MSDAKDNPKDQPNSEQAFAEKLEWWIEMYGSKDEVATHDLLTAHQQAVTAAEEQAWHKAIMSSTLSQEAVKVAEVAAFRKSKQMILEATGIPNDAKNPTRDWLVIWGEKMAERFDAELEKRGAL